MTETKYRIQWYDVGCHVHTALRKYADSEMTSLLYNLIHYMPSGEGSGWEAICKAMFTALRRGELKGKGYEPGSGRQFADNLTWYGDGRYYPGKKYFEEERSYNEFGILALNLRMCSDNDWEAMLGFFQGEEEWDPEEPG